VIPIIIVNGGGGHMTTAAWVVVGVTLALALAFIVWALCEMRRMRP
jgi:hypothetical protein